MIEIKASMRPWLDAIQLYILDKSGGKLMSARNIMMETIEEGQIISPSLEITQTAAQALIDQLWNCGLRPTEGSGSAGSLAATERRLRDIQSISMALLRKNGADLGK